MANKKVNQLSTKSSVLTGDLVPLADATTGQLYKATLSSLGAVIGSAVASVNGLVGVVVLDTDDIQELSSPTNKWYTDSRARAALSAGTGISYNSGTGVISSSITQYTDSLARAAISLTVTGSSGASTYNSTTGVFNIPTYTLAGLGGVPTSRTLTINGTALDLSADRSWTINSMVYPGAGIPVSTGTAWGTSITNNSDNWNTAYGWGNHAGLYLPIGGGTLTGALLGTTAGFSGKITANHSSAGDYAAVFYNSSATGEGVIVRGGSSSSYNAFIVQNFNGTTTLFKVLASGDSTFSNIVTAASFVKSGGTSAEFLKADGSVDSSTYLTTTSAAAQYQPIGTYATGSGETSRLARWTSTSYISVAQIWDDGTNIGIGQAPGSYKLDVTGTMRVTGAATFSSSVTATSLNLGSSYGSPKLYLYNDGTYVNGFGIYANEFRNFFDTIDASASRMTWGKQTAGGTFTEFMRLTKDGNVGIGTTSPSATLHTEVNSSTWIAKIINTNTSTNNAGLLVKAGVNSGNEIILAQKANGTSVFLVDASGNVGIGTTSPTSLLDVKGSASIISLNNTSTGSFSSVVYKYADSYLGEIGATAGSGQMQINMGPSAGWGGFITFKTDTSERMRITSGGNVAIGATSAAYKLTVVGDIRGYKLIGGEAGVGAGNYTIFSNDDNVGYIDTVRAVNSGDFQFRFSGTSRVTISTGGNVTATGFFESSDKKLKTLIEDNYQAKGIETITPKLYTKNGVTELGYYAQDVEEILPSAVTTGADGFLNLSYREVHTAKIARLEKEIEELKAKLN